MQKLILIGCLLLFGLLASRRAESQVLYYNTSSPILSQNELAGVNDSGSGQSTLFTANGSGAGYVTRCTAMALDALNQKMFLLDGVNNSLWSINLTNGASTLIKSGLTNFPTDLSLDVQGQKIYYTTSSTIQDNNTVQRIDYTGSNNTSLFIATGAPADNAVARCTAIALDVANSKIFMADAGARKIWSMNLAGGGLVALASITNSVPTGLALDVANQQVYFTSSSSVQSSNFIQRADYNGSGLITLFTASGSVQRCTALDLDLVHGTIYLSDAGANALWRIPISGGSATSLLSGLSATAKKLRWFNGPDMPPRIISFNLSGANAFFNATNGFAGESYYVLTSTNVALPLTQWSMVSTNVLTTSGNFNITATNALIPHVPHQFYTIQVE